MNKPIMILLAILVACGQKTDTVSKAEDSLRQIALQDSVMAAQYAQDHANPVVQTIVEAWGHSYAPDIFRTQFYDSTLMLLKAAAIPVDKGKSSENSSLTFGGTSVITFIVYDKDHGDTQVICTAEITAEGFPLKNGITVGMARNECLTILGITDDMLTEVEPGISAYSHQYMNGSGDSGYMELRFSSDTFVGLKFHDPCADPMPEDSEGD